MVMFSALPSRPSDSVTNLLFPVPLTLPSLLKEREGSIRIPLSPPRGEGLGVRGYPAEPHITASHHPSTPQASILQAGTLSSQE